MLNTPLLELLMYFQSTLDSSYLLTFGFPPVHSKNLKGKVCILLIYINIHNI